MDIDVIRNDFPSIGRTIYMNNASSAPMPISSIKAMMDLMLLLSEHGPDSRVAYDRINELLIDTRKRLAKMLNCNEQEIVFTQSTTDGINFVSKGLRLREGDSIVIGDARYEHPANYIPWIRLEGNGVKIKRLTINDDYSLDLEGLREMIDDSTKLIAMSHVSFNTGLILPVEEVSKIAREYSIPFFIDAAQSVGALEVDLAKIDCNFLSFPASKWLCGPSGIGVFYCKKSSQELLEPLLVGLNSTFVTNDKILLKDIPERFEAGFRNYAGIAAFNSSLRYVMNLGIDNIRKRDMDLARILREGLRDSVMLYGSEKEDCMTSIVSFATRDVDYMLNRLESEYIILAKRDIGGKNIVRASPHFFNNEEEAMKVVRFIKSIL